MHQPSSQVPIPITLNFSGGISLGAYMAGIFYELIREATQENPRIVIDIITGASAGAITGTLAAYYLLGADRLPEEAEKSLFYKAWVEQADITNIQAKQDLEIDDETGQKNRSPIPLG
jgi:predicted acylesterase/phospholipase RssA